jgi:hypothetical protein
MSRSTFLPAVATNLHHFVAASLELVWHLLYFALMTFGTETAQDFGNVWRVFGTELRN